MQTSHLHSVPQVRPRLLVACPVILQLLRVPLSHACGHISIPYFFLWSECQKDVMRSQDTVGHVNICTYAVWSMASVCSSVCITVSTFMSVSKIWKHVHNV
jgi:hypothetical protein